MMVGVNRAVSTGSVLRVLLVEDSAMLADRICEELRNLEDVEVIAVVDNQKDATDWVRKGSVDVIVLDLQLKQGSGFGVLRGLGERRPAIIIMTNHVLPEYRVCAKRLGADHFLNKSNDYVHLADVVGSLRDTRCKLPA
jgi:two-component system, OmpR family, response regulator